MSTAAVSVVKAYMAMPWGQLHYRTVPSDPALPLLIMLHQSPLSSRNYESLLPLLSEHCRPVALDTPGYGGSTAVPEQWEVADYAKVVWDVADTMGADRVLVFGRATGAVFALEAALTQPQRVHGLVLHGLPVYTDAERADRMRSFAPPFLAAADGAESRASTPGLTQNWRHTLRMISYPPDQTSRVPIGPYGATTCRNGCLTIQAWPFCFWVAEPIASASCIPVLWRSCRGHKRYGLKARPTSWPNSSPPCSPTTSRPSSRARKVKKYKSVETPLVC